MSVAPLKGLVSLPLSPYNAEWPFEGLSYLGESELICLWTRETGLGRGGSLRVNEIMCSSLHCSQGRLPPGEPRPNRAPLFSAGGPFLTGLWQLGCTQVLSLHSVV